MLPARPSYVLKLSFAIPLLLLLQGPASAGRLHPFCHRKPCCEIRNCEFYGYYPTCWQRWPAGWLGCPAPEVEVELVPMPPANAETPELETLPPPKPSASAPAKLPDTVGATYSPYHRLLPIPAR